MIIVIKRQRGCFHRGVGREHRFAAQVCPRLRDQCPQGEDLMLLDWHHLHDQRNLGDGIDEEEYLPAVDRALDRVDPTRLSSSRTWRVT